MESENTIDHLNERERKVRELVFALARCLLDDLHEAVSVMLFDSFDALDSTRIGSLIDNFSEYAM
ncbi:hypothetical protein [Halorhabdus salina]|uniref:hypothetical protein n=1 Tax=Halorhabdus salina TaxID=2750670 RepID=UPI0015EE5047|nr:hypothetical protein [Halorhabdus salina]